MGSRLPGLILTAAVVSACLSTPDTTTQRPNQSIGAPTESQPTEREAALLPLPTHSFTGAGGVLFEATLASGGGCVWLESETRRYTAIWPQGFFARGSPVKLLDPHGLPAATVGDVLAVDASDRRDVVIDVCQVSPDALIIGEIVAVNGVKRPTNDPLTPAPRPPVIR